MNTYNYYCNGNKVNIIHLAGLSLFNYTNIMTNLLTYIDTAEYKDGEYDIISCWTNPDKCILYKLLSKYNIPLINCVPEEDFDKKWYMPNKIKYIINTLKNLNKDIVLILDGYDVLFSSFKNIVKKFKKSKYHILYNATKFNYPSEDIGIIDDINSDWRYFNAGCCIGYRKDLIKFYTEALKYLDIDNPYNSEQYVLRHVFEKYKGTDFVMFEYNPNIFVTMGLTYIAESTSTNDVFILSNGYLGYTKTNKLNHENTV